MTRQQIPDGDLDMIDNQRHRSSGHPSREDIDGYEDRHEYQRRALRRNTYIDGVEI